jgi:hypothetical protein
MTKRFASRGRSRRRRDLPTSKRYRRDELLLQQEQQRRTANDALLARALSAALKGHNNEMLECLSQLEAGNAND